RLGPTTVSGGNARGVGPTTDEDVDGAQIRASRPTALPPGRAGPGRLVARPAPPARATPTASPSTAPDRVIPAWLLASSQALPPGEQQMVIDPLRHLAPHRDSPDRVGSRHRATTSRTGDAAAPPASEPVRQVKAS